MRPEEKLVMQLAVFDFSYVRQPMNLRYILSSGILPLCVVNIFRSVNMSRNVMELMYTKLTAALYST